VRVVRERLDDVRPRVDELAVQLTHEVRFLEYDLRDECAGLKVTASLELEQIPLGADHGSVAEPILQPAHDAIS
jgi:hypothetical protein